MPFTRTDTGYEFVPDLLAPLRNYLDCAQRSLIAADTAAQVDNPIMAAEARRHCHSVRHYANCAAAQMITVQQHIATLTDREAAAVLPGLRDAETALAAVYRGLEEQEANQQ